MLTEPRYSVRDDLAHLYARVITGCGDCFGSAVPLPSETSECVQCRAKLVGQTIEQRTLRQVDRPDMMVILVVSQAVNVSLVCSPDLSLYSQQAAGTATT